MKKLLAMLLALVMSLSLAACGDSGSSTGGSTGGETTYRDTINIAVDVDAETYNPVQYNNSTANRVAELIYDGLISLNAEQVAQPGLAETWEISPDSLTWTFHLRSGVKFSDGSDFTSADVKYTYESMLDKANNAPYRSRYTSISEIECPDDSTVIFHLSSPNVALMVYLDLPILPEGAMDVSGFGTAPVGTGPYYVESYQLNNVTVLKANESYWGGAPATPNINVYVINDNSVRLASLESGDVDFICSPLTASDLSLVEGNDALVMEKVPGLGFTYMGFNVEDPIMSDLAVRQAIAYATDKESISKVIYSGMDTPGTTPLLSSSWAADGSLKDYGYNPEQAKQTLEDAGWVDADGDGIREKNGTKLSITLSTHTDDSSRFQVVEFMQKQLKDIGIDVTVSVTEWASFNAAMQEHTLQVWVAGWLNILDPDKMYDMFYTGGANNFGLFSDPAVDTALDTGRQNSDEAVRGENYRLISQTVTDQVWYNVLVEQAFVAIHSAKLEGYTVYPSGSYRTLWQARVAN